MDRIVVYIVLFTFGYSSRAQTTIQYGDNLEHSISTYGEVDTFTFQGTSGDFIFIRMRDESLVDSHIRLIGPDGIIIQDKFSDGGLAEVKDLELIQTGTYTLLLADKNHNDTGNYGISLHQLNDPPYATPIPCFFNLSDSISSFVGVYAYSFQADHEDVLYAQMRAETEHLEPLFYIYDHNGFRINKSNREGRMAVVKNDSIPHTGRYTIFIMDQGGNDKDSFGFSLQLLNHHECADQVVCCETTIDQIPHLAARNSYRLTLDQHQRALVQMRAYEATLESKIEVYNGEGELIISSWGSDKMLSLELDEEDMGASLLIVTDDYHGNDIGNYGLHFQAIVDNHCYTPLTCGDGQMNGIIEKVSESKAFAIEGVAGEEWSFRMNEDKVNPKMEPQLRLYDPFGQLMEEAIDIEEAVISGIFEYTGTYLLLAGDKGGNDTGNFSVAKDIPYLNMEMEECVTAYLGYDDTECVTLDPEIENEEEMNLHYLWSTGETTPSIQFCPEADTEVSVEVWTDHQCIETIVCQVYAVDAICHPNGSKVTVCHHPPGGGTPDELCITLNAVPAHIDGGQGHDGCHVGSCNYQPCEGESGGLTSELPQAIYRANLAVTTHVFPNPAADRISLSWEYPMQNNPSVVLMDFNGNIISHQFLGELNTWAEINIPGDLKNGIYLIVLQNDYQRITKKIQVLK
jgi:hypothetical protein